MSRYTNDVDTVRNFLSMGFVQTISSLVSVVATFGMMLFLSLRLTAIMLVFIAIMLLIIRAMGSKSGKYFRAQQKALGAANGFIEETIEGQKVVKIFNHEEKVLAEFGELNDGLQHAGDVCEHVCERPDAHHGQLLAHRLRSHCGGRRRVL